MNTKQNRIHAGDRVRIRPEWQDEGDDQIEFVAIEDEDGGRVRVGALNVLSSCIPNQVVLISMVEKL